MRLALLALLPVLPTTSWASATLTKSSLCAAGEKELFSCPIRSKVASVCGMRDGKAEYRFGQPGRIELQSHDLHRAFDDSSGGGEDQVWVQVGNYRYIIYSKTVRTGFDQAGHNDPQFASGLVVQKGGRLLSSVRCGGSGDQPIDGDDRKYMSKGEFISH